MVNKKQPVKLKFNRTRRAAYLNLLSEGYKRGRAAKKVGVHRNAVQKYYTKHPKFYDAMTRAEMDAEDDDVEEVEDALVGSAKGGNVIAAQVVLYNLRPNKWRDRRNITLAGDKDNPININVKTVADLVKHVSERRGSSSIRTIPTSGRDSNRTPD